MYNKETSTEIVENYDKLLRKLAHRAHFKCTRFSYEDMLSEARVAALEAKEKWIPEKGKNTKFSTYLTSYVRGKLKRFKKANTYDIRVTEYKILKDWQEFKDDGYELKIKNKLSGVAKSSQPNPKHFVRTDAIALRLDWPTGSDDLGGESVTMGDIIPSGELPPDEAMVKKEELTILYEEIDKLTEREQHVIRGRFFEGKKLVELADELNMKKQTVHNIEKKAKNKLAEHVKKRYK